MIIIGVPIIVCCCRKNKQKKSEAEDRKDFDDLERIPNTDQDRGIVMA
jgi:hypothetical protein